MNEKKKNFLTALMCVGIGLGCGLGTAISPIMQKMIEAFPDVPVATVRMTSTIVSLMGVCVSIPLSAIFGAKLKFKPIMILGAIFTIAGALPVFIKDVSFGVVMASRIFVGIGFGFFTLRNAAIRKMFSDDPKKAATWLGIITSVQTAVSTAIKPIAGFLGDIKWQYTFYVYLIAVISLFANIFIFKEPVDNLALQTETQTKAPRGKLNPKVIFFSLTIIIGTLFSYPIFTGMSTLIKARGLGEAAISGTVTSMYSLGQVAISAIFGVYYQKMGRWGVGTSILTMALGFGLISAAYSIVPAIIGAFLCGFGFMGFSLSHTKWAGDVSDTATRTFAATLLTTSISIGSFLSSYWISFANKLGGTLFSFLETDAERTYLLSTVLFVIMGALFLIRDPRPNKE